MAARVQIPHPAPPKSTEKLCAHAHPGYVGAILATVSTPLTIGSVFGLVPAGIVVILIFVRTALEDKTLHNELDGYSDYAHKVRYRLLPWVW